MKKGRPRFYDDIYTHCLVCGEGYQRSFSPPHHPLRREQMTWEEICNPAFFIDLCRQHHTEIETSPTISGLLFYLHYKILDKVREHINFDKRFEKWIDIQKYKIKQLQDYENSKKKC